MGGVGRERVVVGMSGGVDSSVAAALLLEQGYDVVGITMQLYDRQDTGERLAGSCCSLDDVHDARKVAENLGIPFYVVNFEDAFKKLIVDNLTDEYLQGRTPNPCVRCNEFMKFRLLLRRALELDAAFLATGHYAQIAFEDGAWRLRRAVDPLKDQSYFLHPVGQKQLSRLRFPLGGMTKNEVRDHARRFGLATAEKDESQDLCFIAGERYTDFIARTIDPDRIPGEGNIVDLDGNVVGSHQGHHRYTVGQRKGIGVAASQPLFVVRLEPENNRVVVGGEADLLSRQTWVERFQWVTGTPPEKDELVEIQIRYRSMPVAGRVLEVDSTRVRVGFADPVKAVTPGKTLVVYRGDEVLGGGVIADRSMRVLPLAS